MTDLLDQIGNIDIYFFDQLLKGRVSRDDRFLDAGCGGGRNVVYMMREGYCVYGVDQNPRAILAIRRQALDLAGEAGESGDVEDRFREESLEAMTFPDGTFDFVLCNAVFHFARDDDHFHRMVRGVWRVVKPGGVLFARLASSIGIEDRVQPIGENVFRLPDGSDRYLVDEEGLVRRTEELGAELVDPIKTVNVQGLRCMTNWCVRKRS